MQNLLQQYLQAFDILSAEEVELIVRESDIRFFPKGSILLREGEIARHCYFVLKGCVREFVLKEGEDRSTNFFLEGDSVTAFSSQRGTQVSARNWECLEDCILTVGTEQLEKEMCQKIPRLADFILQEVENQNGRIQDQLAHFIISNPEERYGQLLAQRPEIFQRVPQHQIASYIGIKPESLSRLKSRLQKKGL
ncbi:Crp/Fnr family transcriptional regulator [Persicobacter diffluens]|uniref:Cyclic nucleotide-binding protein n=1 Tax=Persicobacter diffluens TaxID=981 RepID=A0AAN5ANH2_9BACT|nr:cyclic nucleotide-binding protein [Persicobacter diffluens]